MDEIYCIKGEIHNILATLKFERNFSNGSIFDLFSAPPNSSERLFFKSLKSLNEKLTNYKSLVEFNSYECVKPFCVLLKECKTSPELVLSCLQSLHKFLQYSLIKVESINAEKAAECLFQGLKNIQIIIEYVQIKKIQVILTFLKSPIGELLSDSNIILLLKECIKPRLNRSASLTLIKYSEDSFSQIILYIFTKLWNDSQNCKNNQNIHQPEIAEYILNLLARMINPHNKTRERKEIAEDLIILGLKLLIIALESGGSSLKEYPILCRSISDELCKQILQCSQTQNLKILSYILRVVFIFFHTLRDCLKVQIEVFLSSIHLRIGESQSSNLQQKELVLESLAEFAFEPDLIAGIFRNYDCEMGLNNLFEEITKMLSKFAFPQYKNDSQTNKNLVQISGEAIIFVMNSIEEKFCNQNDTTFELDSTPNHSEINCTIEHKRKLLEASKSFNEHGEKSVHHLQNLGVIDKPITAESMAAFLKKTPKVSKTKICSYLSQNKEINRNVLKHFIALFDFTGIEIDEALRNFLGSLTLRGESQNILRVLEEFSAHYYKQNPELFRNVDVCYVVVSAIIMLNTDLYNDQVIKKIQIEEFKKVLKGIDDGNDLQSSFVERLYKSIETNELKALPNDLRLIISDKEIDKAHWKHLISKRTEKWEEKVANDHGYKMFQFIWDSAITVITLQAQTCHNKKQLSKLKKNVKTYVEICSIYNCAKYLNKLLISLSLVSIDMLDSCCSNKSFNSFLEGYVHEILLQQNIQIFFQIVNKYDAFVKESWPNLFFVVMSLHALDILPENSFSVEDFTDVGNLPFQSFRENKDLSLTSKIPENEFKNYIKTLNESDIEETFFNSIRIENMKSILRILSKVISCSSIKEVFDYKICRFLNTYECKIFALDRLSDIIERNRSLTIDIYHDLIKMIFSLLKNVKSANFFAERTIVNILRISVVLFTESEHISQIEPDIKNLFEIFIKLDDSVITAFRNRLEAFALIIIELKGNFSLTDSGKETFYSFLVRLALCGERSVGSMDTISDLLARKVSTCFEAKMILDLVSTLTEHTSHLKKNNIEKIREITLLMFTKMDLVDEKDREIYFRNLVEINYKIVISNAPEALDREEKSAGLDILEKLLFSDMNSVSHDAKFVFECLEKIIHPLLNYCYTFEKHHLKKKIQNDPNTIESQGNGKTLAKIEKMLIRMFLQNIEMISESKEFPRMWIKHLNNSIIYAFKYFRKSGDEAFVTDYTESVKNLLRVCKTNKSFLELRVGDKGMIEMTSELIDSFPSLIRVYLSKAIGNFNVASENK